MMHFNFVFNEQLFCVTHCGLDRKKQEVQLANHKVSLSRSYFFMSAKVCWSENLLTVDTKYALHSRGMIVVIKLYKSPQNIEKDVLQEKLPWRAVLFLNQDMVPLKVSAIGLKVDIWQIWHSLRLISVLKWSSSAPPNLRLAKFLTVKFHATSKFFPCRTKRR